MAVQFAGTGTDSLEYTAGSVDTTNCTWTAWVYISTNRASTSTFLRTMNSGGSTNLRWSTGSDGLSLVFASGGSGEFASGISLAVGRWARIAWSISGTTGVGYGATSVDGPVTAWTNNVSGNTPATRFALGGRGNSDSTESLNGRLAAVKIYTGILTQAEIQAEWAQTLPVRTAGLWAAYPLDNSSTREGRLDYSGNGRALTAGSTLTADGPPIPRQRILIRPWLAATARTPVSGTASANLGGLAAATTGKRTTRGTAAAQLGVLSGAATAVASRLVTWSGHTWAVRPDFGQPGPNYWGTTTSSVALDGTDLLLKIANLSGTWTSAEVDRIGANLGYGRYRWTYSYDVEHMDYKPVLGLYVYDQDPGSAPSQREIDIEVTKWNYAPETSTAWYSVHPTADGEHRESDHVQSFAAPYTGEFIWQAGQVYFRTVDANGVLLGEHVVTEGVQAPGTEQPSMNLWLIDGDPPSDGLPVTATIHSFAFDAGVTHSLVAADTQTDDFAAPWKFAVKDGASITGGELVLPCTSGYTSAYTGSTFDLRNSSTQIEISGVPTPAGNFSQEVLWYLRHDADNYLMMFVSGGSFVGRRRQGGVNSDTALGTHNPTTHRFWRVALSGSTVSYQTSANGLSWSTLGTATTTLTSQQLSTLRHRFECGHWAAETSPADFKVTTLGVQTTKFGTAAAALSGLTAAAVGHRDVTGAAAAPLGGLTGAATGRRITAGSATAALGVLSSSSAGHRNRAGSASAALGGLASAASGLCTVLGTGAASLGALTATAAGHRNRTGTALSSLGALSAGASSVRTVLASASSNLAGLTATAAGHRNGVGTAAAPLGAIAATATGVPHVLATAAAPLGALTSTATGVRARPGTALASLGVLSSSAASVRTTTGVGSASLGALSGSASSTPRGTASSTLGALTGSATGLVRVPGTAVAGLGGLQATTTSLIKHSGTASAALGTLSGLASGRVTVTGSAAAPLGRLVSSSTSATVGAAQANLGALTATSTGRRVAPGAAASQLGVLAASAAGMVVAYGTAAAHFGGLTSTAVGHGAPKAGASAPLGSLLSTAVGARVIAAAAVALLGQLRAAAVVDELQGPVHAGIPTGPSTRAGVPSSPRLTAGAPSGRVVHAGPPTQTR